MRFGIRTAVVSLALIASPLIPGCASKPDATPQAQSRPAEEAVPEFTLKLRTSTVDNRFTNFQITAKGFLSYGAGRTAMIGEVNPVRMLTAAERARILALVDKYKLEEAPNAIFRKSRKVDYLFSFNRGLLGVTIESVDDETQGFRELRDLLMEIQADGR